MHGLGRRIVITSYSRHYTKLYEVQKKRRGSTRLRRRAAEEGGVIDMLHAVGLGLAMYALWLLFSGIYERNNFV